jgi:hypothetical protein
VAGVGQLCARAKQRKAANIVVESNPAIQPTLLSPKTAQHLSDINATPIQIGDFST